MRPPSIILKIDDTIASAPFAFPHNPVFDKDVRLQNGVARLRFEPNGYYLASEETVNSETLDMPRVYVLTDITIIHDSGRLLR